MGILTPEVMMAAMQIENEIEVLGKCVNRIKELIAEQYLAEQSCFEECKEESTEKYQSCASAIKSRTQLWFDFEKILRVLPGDGGQVWYLKEKCKLIRETEKIGE
jgi:hypothetical protein